MNRFLQVLVLALTVLATSAASSPKPKRVIVLIADGNEPIEALSVVGLLRFAGIDVTLAGVKNGLLKNLTNNVFVKADVSLASVASNTYDAFVLLGGYTGPIIVAGDELANKMLLRHYNAGKLIATTCGGAISLLKNKIFLGQKITAHPYFENLYPKLLTEYKFVHNKGVVDVPERKLITAQGPTTAFEFAFTIIKNLIGEKAIASVKEISRYYYTGFN